MKHRNARKILLSAGIAAATVALSASIVAELPARPDQSASHAENRVPGIPAASTLAFDSSPSQMVAARKAVRAYSAPSGASPVSALQLEARGEVSVSADPVTGGTSMARAEPDGDLFPQGKSLPPAEKISAFLERHGEVFGIADAANELRVIDMQQDQYGYSRVTYQQMHGDVPVFGAVMHGHVASDGRLTAVNGKFIPEVDLPRTPLIDRAAASRTASAVVSEQLPSRLKDADLKVAAPSLYVYREFLTRGTPGENHLAYEIEVKYGNNIREFVYVDALNGKVVDQISGIQGAHDGAKHRTIYQSNKEENNLTVVWDEEFPSNTRPALDPSVEDQVSGAGYSYNLFLNLSNSVNPPAQADGNGNYHTEWRSWDGDNADMLTINTDPTIVCPNANWNGTSTNYCVGVTSDDVVAHEWGHAYTQETSGLIYAWQSGALNESYSDIWGETVDLINNREGVSGPTGTAAAPGHDGPRSQDEAVCSDYNSETNPGTDSSYRWLMGEDAAAFAALPPAGDSSIRDMWNPRCASGEVFVGSDPGHVTSNNYHCDASDGGGVHTNSAVNNRAYALLVDGNTLELRDDGTPFESPVTVQGIGLTKAAHIFWRANSVYNTPASNFIDNANSLRMACQDLIGQPLTKLVTSAEVGTYTGTGGAYMPGYNDDTLDPANEQFTGEALIAGGPNTGPITATITAGDCAQVEAAIQAVEMDVDVTKQCGFKPMLSSAPAPMCGSAAVVPTFAETFDAGFPADWSTDGISVNQATKSTANWVAGLFEIGGRSVNAAFQENVREYGNCADDDESGNQWLESPVIVLDENAPSHLMFEHYFNSEISYDGGNVKINVNGGGWDVIPAGAFVHNAYNGALETTANQNTNTMSGQEAWHGGNAGEARGSWGQSQIDLKMAGADKGDSVQLRWDFGQDGCNGSGEGWYIDSVDVFSCGEDIVEPPSQCQSYPADIADGGVDIFTDQYFLTGFGTETTAEVVGQEAPVSDVNIRNLKGEHPYMGDLRFALSHGDTTVTLFDGSDCAGEDGIDIEFDDSADDVAGCSNWQSGDAFRSFEALSAFNGADANGSWILFVADGFQTDDGRLDEWAIELCQPLPLTANAGADQTALAYEVVYFDGSESQAGSAAAIAAYHWDFGDGGSASGVQASHAYAAAGDYTVTLTVTDEAGGEAVDTALVTVYSDSEEIPGGDEAKGSGKLNAIPLDDDDDSSDDDAYIDFHFDPKRKSDGELKGHLHLKDKDADVKIHLKDVTSIRAELGPVCSMIVNGSNAIEFEGVGTFEEGDNDKVEGARFLVCATDNDALDKNGKKTEKSKDGESMDLFHLECLDRCSYDTSARVLVDEVIDKGNIRIKLATDGESAAAASSADQGAASEGSSNTSGESSAASTEPGASTVFLEPALLSDGAIGALQVFKVNVFDSDFQPLSGRTVSLSRSGADGSYETLNAISGPTGTALFNVTLGAQPSDYDVKVDGVSSNGVSVRPLLQ